MVALCNCSGTNVVVFKQNVDNISTVHFRSCITDPSMAPMLTASHVSAHQTVVRSHFEKLSLVDHSPNTFNDNLETLEKLESLEN